MNGIPSYLNPFDAGDIRKSLVDDKLKRAQTQLAMLKTAPDSLSDEQFNELFNQVKAEFLAGLEELI